jgi:hypothetical protein
MLVETIKVRLAGSSAGGVSLRELAAGLAAACSAASWAFTSSATASFSSAVRDVPPLNSSGLKDFVVNDAMRNATEQTKRP